MNRLGLGVEQLLEAVDILLLLGGRPQEKMSPDGQRALSLAVVA